MSEPSEPTRDQVLGWVIRGLPYSDQCRDWDTSSDMCVRFTWRGTRFRVSVPGMTVEEVDDGFLRGSNLAICVEQLIKIARITDELNNAKVPA